MATRNITRLACLLVLLLPLAAYAAEQKKVAKLDRYDRQAVLTLADVSMQLYIARAESRWKTIYSFISPSNRKHLPFATFFRAPHMPSGRVIVKAGEETAIVPEGKLAGKRYIPRYIFHRPTKIWLDDSRSFAKVVSEVGLMIPRAISPLPIYTKMREYFRLIDGVWYQEWALPYMEQLSGANSAANFAKMIPKLTKEIDVQKLAKWYISKGEAIENRAVAETLFKKALRLDPYGTAERLSGKGWLPQSELSAAIEQAVTGRRKVNLFFPSDMELGYWYGVVEEYPKSYKAYSNARRADSGRLDALEGMALAAIGAGDFANGAESFVQLMELASITKEQPAKTLEPYLAKECLLCEKLTDAQLLPLAARLISVKRYKEAAVMLYHLMPDDLIHQLADGESIQLSALPGGVRLFVKRLTYQELSKLLAVYGIGLSHPADVYLAGEKTIQLTSVARKIKRSYTGGYISGSTHAVAEVSSTEVKGMYKKGGQNGGYILLNPSNKKVASGKAARFYKDSESKELLAVIDGLPTGELLYMARLPVGVATIIPMLKKRFSALQLAGCGGVAKAEVIIIKKGFGGICYGGAKRVEVLLSPAEAGSGAAGVLKIDGLLPKSTARFFPN